MCGFLFASYDLSDDEISKSESLVTHRGPDLRSVQRVDGCTYVHYLLHITGELTRQPLMNEGIRLLYNGEIYNYKDLGDFPSDGYAILSVYREHGIEGLRCLDGEFGGVIHDTVKNKVFIIRDTFGTKPVVAASDEARFAVASYPSQLHALGFKNVSKVPINSLIEIDISTSKTTVHQYRKFDLHQHKTSYEDWKRAFRRSVLKRTENKQVKYFIGLSSGYDSGAIASVMNSLGVDYNSYTIRAAEDPNVLAARAAVTGHNRYIELSTLDYEKSQRHLQECCEPYVSPPRKTRPSGYDLFRDKGAVGTSHICALAREDGCRVYLSGQGSDEILSDYGHAGQPAPGFLHTTLAGLYPANLEGVFPWENFFGGTQEEFLAKDEYVGGSHGLETRYPFLDFEVVQEFLWLSSELKNRAYKAPVEDLLLSLGYPMASGGLRSKVGFRANSNLK